MESTVDFDEVRARRMVIVDDNGDERIVAEVLDGQANLRLASGRSGPPSCVVVLYASPRSEAAEMGPSVGLQLWADGNSYLEVNLWNEGTLWTSAISTDDPTSRRPKP